MQRISYKICTIKGNIVNILNADNCKYGMIGQQYNTYKFESDIMDAITYSLHNLDSKVLPPNFSVNVKKVENNAMHIGDFKFLDPKLFSVTNCCIGFELFFSSPKDKIIVGFYLDDIESEMVYGDLSTNPNQSLFFEKIVNMFYKCIYNELSRTINNCAQKIAKALPAEYEKKTCDFMKLDIFISKYPYMIAPNESNKYKYLIVDKIMDIKCPERKLPTIFSYIETKYGLTFEPEMHTNIVKFVVDNENAYLKSIIDPRHIFSSEGEL